MTLAQIIILVLKASVAAMVFAAGLGLAPGDLVRLFRRPGLLLRSLISMFLVMLVTAAAVARIADLKRPVEIVIVCLALAPIPPLLPSKQTKAGGEASYIYGLIVTASVFALVWIPVVVEGLARVSGQDLSAPVADLASIVGAMILAPLAAGVLIGRYAPRFATKAQQSISRVASLVLLLGLALIFLKSWRAMLMLVGDGTLAALAGFVLVGLGVGHLLGGPDREDRTVLALASACRHPGIALSLASLNFPAEKSVLAVTLLYLVVSALLTIPYVTWSARRSRGQVVASTAP